MKRSFHSGNSHIKFRQARRFRQVMTPSEALLWTRFRGNRLMGLHFRRQHVIRGFIVDFCCHQAKLIVEIDSSVHQSQAGTDRMRDSILVSLGLFVLRLPSTDLENDIESAVKMIRGKCRERISGGQSKKS